MKYSEPYSFGNKDRGGERERETIAINNSERKGIFTGKYANIIRSLCEPSARVHRVSFSFFFFFPRAFRVKLRDSRLPR